MLKLVAFQFKSLVGSKLSETEKAQWSILDSLATFDHHLCWGECVEAALIEPSYQRGSLYQLVHNILFVKMMTGKLPKIDRTKSNKYNKNKS